MTAAARRSRLAGLQDPANDTSSAEFTPTRSRSQDPEADPKNPVALSQALIRCASVTPADNGALGVIERALSALGFTCHRLVFEAEGTPPIANLYARLGTAAPNLVFAGHTDVVPPGDLDAWTAAPFAGEIVDGELYGRGAVDMKGAVGCFVAAVARFLDAGSPAGSISLLITGDEEGPAINGTVKVLNWLAERGETLDACVVGEPTNPDRLGQMIKIGRRGSLSGRLTVRGVQGHVAYPHRADNPIIQLSSMLRALAEPLDEGSEHFPPSMLVPTTFDVGNEATNVIPGEARANFNIRFNDRHTPESLEAWLREKLDAVGGNYQLETRCSGPAFLTEPGPLTKLMETVIRDELGVTPELSTSGGTSDARFIKNACPVIEFGLVGQTMHQVDERVRVADLEALTGVYQRLLGAYVGAI
ncbi:MAG: succinyl-diaminopimelate desuccinylase [Geminicoccaceae bacterium]